MPPKEIKRYITDRLTSEELSEIDRIKAIEDVWWGKWYDIIDNDGDIAQHWSYRGEDAHRNIQTQVFGNVYEKAELLLDMRGMFYTDSQTGENKEIGWVIAERIIPWERGVVPTAINWFVNRFFGRELFGYQLYFYYQTTPKMMIVGGRGSAKTEGLALTMAAWAALHPGEKWAHYAYQGSQANEAYNTIIDLGSNRQPLPGQTEEEAAYSFAEVFVKSSKLSPYAQIRFIPWDVYDPGNIIYFRPLGHRQGATSLRSISAQRGSLDEVTHDLPDKEAIAVAEGTIRGVNAYWMKRLSKELQREIRASRLVMREFDEISRRRPLTESESNALKNIKRQLRKYRITAHLGTIRTGNRGPYLWVDEDLQRSIEHPDEIYARVVSYLINPHLDYKARRALEATYSDPALARVELFAERAIGSGGWFSVPHLLSSESSLMDEEMQTAIDTDTQGYVKRMYGAHLVHWQVPYNNRRIYVMGADPGTGIVPRRDSWNVQVWELDLGGKNDDGEDVKPVAKLAYFRWGNTRKKMTGSWNPFLAAVEDAIRIYKIPQSHAIIQVGGQERGILEATYGAKQRVRAINVTAPIKAKWANWTRQLIAGGYMLWPKSGSSITTQLSDWQMKDDKLIQDIVMGLFGASQMIFMYFEEFINPAEEVDEFYVAHYGRHVGRKRRRRNR